MIRSFSLVTKTHWFMVAQLVDGMTSVVFTLHQRVAFPEDSVTPCWHPTLLTSVKLVCACTVNSIQ